MEASDATKALEEARALVTALESHISNGTKETHHATLKQLDNVRAAFQSPADLAIKMFETLSVAGALHNIISIRAYNQVPSNGRAVSAAAIAASTKVDETVIQRIFRVAVSQGIFVETEPDMYAHNAASIALSPMGIGSFLATMMEANKMFVHLPEYLKTHEPTDIFDLKKSPNVFAEGKEHLGKTYYEVMEEDWDAERRQMWDMSMAMAEKVLPVLGMFPFESLKDQVEKEPERAFLVDVGGGRGQFCRAIMDHVGGSFGAKVIVQDLPGLINSLDKADNSDMEFMVYDAFTPQPVKNAHIYLMRRFLHDFYNDVCINIVKNTASAMGPGSRLIICDMLIPDKAEAGKDTEAYWADFALMGITGKEKKKNEFEKILEEAGLELVQIWPAGVGRTVMVEARLKKA